MSQNEFKPEGYTSLAPYLIIEDVPRMLTLLADIFNAVELRRFEDEEGRVIHVEVKIDDTIIMISESNEEYRAHATMMHVYVKDAIKTFELALERGCEGIEAPVKKEGDPDLRGAFLDFSGNYWAIGTQMSKVDENSHERIKTLAELFVKTGKAHHQAFIDSDGIDPEWPLWYSDYLKDKLVELFDIQITNSEIISELVRLSRENPEPEKHWSEVYAREFLTRYDSE